MIRRTGLIVPSELDRWAIENDFRAVAQQAVEFVHRQFATIVHGDHADDRAGLLGDKLPGDDVGMVFHRREDDFVAGFQEFSAVARCDEVDAFGGAAGEDDLAGFGGVDEAGDFCAGLFVGGGGFLAEGVDAAMNVRVFRFVISLDRIDDDLGLLGRGAVVEIDQRPAVNLCFQDGEIARANRLDVVLT